MIYHIRYTSTYQPASRLVLGTMKATPFGIAAPQPLRAPFRIWHGSAFVRVAHLPRFWAAHSYHHSLPHHPYSPTVLYVQHDHDHGHHAPSLIEGCGRHIITHHELLATSSEQQRRAGQRVAGRLQFTAGWLLNTLPCSEQ